MTNDEKNYKIYKRFRHFMFLSSNLKRRWIDNNRKKKGAEKRMVSTRGR